MTESSAAAGGPGAGDAPAAAVHDPAYEQAVIELLGVIAYGELSAFERLAEDAKLAPTLADKVAIGQMAAAEFGHLARLQERLESLGADPFAAMESFREGFDSFHRHTAPSDWYEGLIKAYVGDGLAADFYREIAAYLDPDTRDLIVSALEDAGQLGIRGRPGPGRHPPGPAPGRPPRAVGPSPDGGGAHPGPAGGRGAGRAHRAARRRRGPSRSRPGRARVGCSPGSPSGTRSGWRTWGWTPDGPRRRAPHHRCGALRVMLVLLGAAVVRVRQTCEREPVLRPVTVEAITTRTAETMMATIQRTQSTPFEPLPPKAA